MRIVPRFGMTQPLRRKSLANVQESPPTTTFDAPVESWNDRGSIMPRLFVVREIDVHVRNYTNYSLRQIFHFLVDSPDTPIHDYPYLPVVPPSTPTPIPTGDEGLFAHSIYSESIYPSSIYPP
jgi:hypothetical protein